MTHQSGVITVDLVDGTKVIVPDSLDSITSYVLREQGDWFEDELRFLRSLVQPGDNVVDIGANYGVYSLSLARKVGPGGRLWAFEPANDTAQMLNASAAINGTFWLTVMQQALSDRDGTAWLQTPGHAELNSLAQVEGDVAVPGSGESVAMTTLDHCLESLGWTTVDLVKIDAEGHEERIIKGGARFFRELSPLVMFEVKAGADLHLELVECFVQLGYQCFRLIPGLNALVPFTADQKVDGFLLNLFAAKPDRAAALAAGGWLLGEVNPVSLAAEDQASVHWLQALQRLPYARHLAADWPCQHLSPEQRDIQRALAAWTVAQDAGESIVRRYAALNESYAILQQHCQLGCPLGRWASLARVARAMGERVQAAEALHVLLEELQHGRNLSLEEPFLSPGPIFDNIEVNESMHSWLEAASLVAFEQASGFSGFYTMDATCLRLERVIGLGYAPESIQNRLGLVKARVASMAQTTDVNSSVRDWFDFLDLQHPIRCIDVGALALGSEPEPWLRWAREGCAEVLGFEPLPEECERLNKRARDSGMEMRYFPWALGDGREHTLHITNVPMTSSLFPPARSTVDLFPALGELMEVVQQLRVQTHRLDDIQEAAAADFLKLDVQGAELLILQNAKACLQSVAVIQCEVEFVELYEGQPLMADVDAYLRSQGFCFFRYAYTMGRPFKPFAMDTLPHGAHSQLLWADAIYVRDFRHLDRWSERQLKAAAFILHEVYQAYDLTARILRSLDRSIDGNRTDSYLAALALSLAAHA